MGWYTSVVSRHPVVVMIAVAVFSISCVVIALTTIKVPDFSDPQLGFESRGTVISERLTAWDNLIEETRPSGSLTVNPLEGTPPPISGHTFPGEVVSNEVTLKKLLNSVPTGLSDWRAEANHLSNVSLVISSEHHNNSNSLDDENWISLSDLDPSNNHFNHHDHDHLSADGYFCGSPTTDYSRVVLSARDDSDLLTESSLKDMCHLEEKLIRRPYYSDICQTVTHDRCCTPWSLPNYIAMLHNRTSCYNITNQDVKETRKLLELCSRFYFELKLMPDYENKDIPSDCSKHNAVYNIIHYLVDITFLPPKNVSGPLKNAIVFLPIARSSAALDFYYSLEDLHMSSGNIYVTAIDFGLKNTVFDECLLRDTWLMSLGSLFVLICMWLYTGSLFITLMTVIAIGFSLGISYFIYTLIFELHFFPFMNLLASIVAIGIGADDAFILCKTWQCAKAENCNLTLARLVQNSLKHSAVSMFVTTLTTAAAFYSSYISAITAIRCFSLFAGTAVMVNFVLMVTWLPACVVVSERVCWDPFSSLIPLLRIPHSVILNTSSFLHNLLVSTVLRLRILWIFILSCIAVASMFVIFYWPKLRLPDSTDFQLFASNHPFEQYDMVYREKFWFERLQKVDTWDNPNSKMPLRFVWGVLPKDTGDFLNPMSKGTLQLDSKFDIAAPESQAWLMRFCHKLRSQPFYQPTPGPLLPNCFLENFVDWMNRKCIDPVDRISRIPCCESARFPFPRKVFNTCIVRAIEVLYRTPAELFIPGVAGPKFAKQKGSRPPKIKAIVVEYDSVLAHTTSYEDMDSFFRQVETWTHQELSKAPSGMRNGFFVSQLGFYDLQQTLARDTIQAIIVSLAVSFVVLLLVTLNLLVSLYAILSISCIIFVTIAILVLIGWKLNVLESVAMTVAIGLAVDFSLHYAVTYRMCAENESREACVMHALSLMSGPILMAALTTGAAGAFMIPSAVLAYIQIGVFLIVVMVVSWLYSTYFLLCLLSIAGPERNFGQMSYPKIRGFCRKKSRTGGDCPGSDKTVYINVLSESTLSTSSTTCALHVSNSETHELDALTRQPCRHSRRLRRSGSLSHPSHSCRNARKISLPADHSPSAASATTIIHDDDYDIIANHVS